METPGHTPESISVLVYEHAADKTPYGVLTGDTLVIGDIARPDLVASFGVTADELARMLYHSIGRVMALPDTVRVFPAHGARGRSPKRSSTIGEQSRTTAARLPVNEDDFVAHVEARRSSTPGYFVHDEALNRSVHDLLYVRLAPLEIDDVLERQAQGALVLDARDPATFAAGHLRGSINVPADGRFAETSGIVADPDDEVVLVAPQDRESELRIRLGRVGFDHIAGYLRDPGIGRFRRPRPGRPRAPRDADGARHRSRRSSRAHRAGRTHSGRVGRRQSDLSHPSHPAGRAAAAARRDPAATIDRRVLR